MPRRDLSPPPTLNLRLGGSQLQQHQQHQQPQQQHNHYAKNTPSVSGTPSRQQQQQQEALLEGPILAFRDFIEETSSEDWQRRITALEDLVASVPDGSAYLNETNWFNSPKRLTHLARPIATLLRDARSSVVRRVCTCLTELFAKCQTDGRYLFKELMNTILDVHGQTVQVIRQAVQTMILEVIPEVPCKSVMPLWMERLKDKSPAVREACSLYLGHALKHWSTEIDYLTNQIWHQVTNAILKTMRDPSPTVRKHAKSILLYIQQSHEVHFQRILQDETGPASQDVKLRHWLMNLSNASTSAPHSNQNTSLDELSVASKYTLRSDNSQAQQPPPTTATSRHQRTSVTNAATLRISTPRKVLQHSNSLDDEDDYDDLQQQQQQQQQQILSIPNSIQVSKATSPKNLLANIQHRRTPPRPNNRIIRTAAAAASSPQAQTYSELANHQYPSPNHDELMEYSDSTSQNNQDIILNNSSPFIRSIQELKQHAKNRRSRHSIILQNRFRESASPAMNSNSASRPPDAMTRSIPTTTTTTTTPEHVLIAIQLLRSHKAHVDSIMETLRLEMDVLRDFDNSLAEPGRPTELELLEYYERVDLCVEQRIALAEAFRREMEHISRGDDTNNNNNDDDDDERSP